MICYGHYIGGAVTDPAAGEWFDTYNPYTGEPWARIARGTAADAEAAVSSARAAFEGWATTKPTARGKLLVRLAELIERDASRLAEVARNPRSTAARLCLRFRRVEFWLWTRQSAAIKRRCASQQTGRPSIRRDHPL